MGGGKADKAKQWSIPVVNHTWLEDCFAAWRNLTPATKKYLHFPPHVNFANMLGGRGFGRIVLDDDLAALEAEAAGMCEDAGEGAEEPESGVKGDAMDVDEDIEASGRPAQPSASTRNVEDENTSAHGDGARTPSRSTGKGRIAPRSASSGEPMPSKVPVFPAKPACTRTDDQVAEITMADEQELGAGGDGDASVENDADEWDAPIPVHIARVPARQGITPDDNVSEDEIDALLSTQPRSTLTRVVTSGKGKGKGKKVPAPNSDSSGSGEDDNVSPETSK